MLSVWYGFSGGPSCVLTSIVLLPDTITAVSQGRVGMSWSFLCLKSVCALNMFSYASAIAQLFGVYASVFVFISTTFQAACLTGLIITKFRSDRPEATKYAIGYTELP